MRYVSIQTRAYSIRLGRDCLFHLTYEAMPWREGSERWFLISAEEIDSPYDVTACTSP